MAYQRIETDRVTFGVWYHGEDEANQTKLGIYVVEKYAHQGKLARRASPYSLGSAAVLATAGVAIDINLIRKHCATKVKQDAGYCNYGRRSVFSRKIPILRQDNALPF